MSQDMSLANVIVSVTDKCSQDILKKFQWAIKRVANEHGTNNKAAALTQDELIQLVKAWEPKRDIICLYVRWARQLRRNFNLDSIATLLCLSRQCRYTPVDFVRQVKTLSIQKNNGKSAYGVTFHFDIPNRKDLDREQLNKEFLGLSVTLAFLQEQITDSPSILGKTRMRESQPRTAFPIGIPIDERNRKSQEHATVISYPNVEFHTQESLLNRIWVSINHRWLALYLTEHLFREPNMSWTYSDALAYSFQMMAPCGPGRFEFLSPLAGYCLRFQTQESIDSKRSQLQSIWKNPSSFMSYGNNCLTQFSEDAQSRIITTCLHDLRSDIPSVERDGQTAYSVESMSLSVVGAHHSRPSKIIGCDWTICERSRNSDPNRGDMCFSGEADRIEFCDENTWITVKHKRRRSAKALVSSTLQYSDTIALSRQNENEEPSKVTGEISTLNKRKDAGIERRRHLVKEHECVKQLLSGSAMINGNTTNEKSRRCQSLVESDLG